MTLTPYTEDEYSWLERLLRGERSAIDAYGLVLARFGEDDARISRLHKNRSEHVLSASLLTRELEKEKVDSSHGAGPWGTFTRSVQEVADLLGEKTALDCLTRGEEHGLVEYHKAMDSEVFSDRYRELVESTLLPRIEGNLRTLGEVERTD